MSLMNRVLLTLLVYVLYVAIYTITTYVRASDSVSLSLKDWECTKQESTTTYMPIFDRLIFYVPVEEQHCTQWSKK